MTQITLKLLAVKERIAASAASCGRDPAAVRLLAVSKKQPVEAILAAAKCGQRDFGENFVQEAVDKMALIEAPLHWHFIGHIQTNKTRAIATHFDWVHTVDRLRVARRLNEQRVRERPLKVCLQVNLSDDPERAGVAPEALMDLAAAVNELENLTLRGLMVMPPVETEAARQRLHFRQLADLAREGRARGLPLNELSMGMTGDLEAAVVEGATWVRIGTAVFGPRPAHGYPNADIA